jgi:hypothetical protein
VTDFSLPEPTRQLGFHELLVAARKLWLRDGLSEALAAVDLDEVGRQIAATAPADARAVLASAGIRDEYVFPTPAVLIAKPTLVGYYRLLIGLPQKTFYSSDTGMGRFQGMERKGTLSQRQRDALPQFCEVMCSRLAELVRQLSPSVTMRDVEELPLLILGSQFQGANNNTIGKQATENVFLAIESIVHDHVTERTETRLTVTNASGRVVFITLASDPDVRIQEVFGEELRNKVAIEIKGGTDASNAHNRAGEAEKSHQKARRAEYRDFWTLIATRGVDADKLRDESPTTRQWFDASQVLAREGDDWLEFRSRVAGEVGIPLSDE